jgi:hypothetical protein
MLHQALKGNGVLEVVMLPLLLLPSQPQIMMVVEPQCP